MRENRERYMRRVPSPSYLRPSEFTVPPGRGSGCVLRMSRRYTDKRRMSIRGESFSHFLRLKNRGDRKGQPLESIIAFEPAFRWIRLIAPISGPFFASLGLAGLPILHHGHSHSPLEDSLTNLFAREPDTEANLAATLGRHG